MPSARQTELLNTDLFWESLGKFICPLNAFDMLKAEMSEPHATKWLSIYSGGKIYPAGFLPSLLQIHPLLSHLNVDDAFPIPQWNPIPPSFFEKHFSQTLTQYQIILNFLWALLPSGSQVDFTDILRTICSATSSTTTLGRTGYSTSEKWPYHTKKHLQTAHKKHLQ